MIYQKVIKVMEDIIPLGKIKRDEIVPKLLPILAKNKIAIKPAEVIDFKNINQEVSFIMKYELVDTEDSGLQSIVIQVPGGGFDKDGKGRATYMATTGAYRQALQQLFAIPIDDEQLSTGNNEFGTDNIDNGEQPEGFSSFDEFQESEQQSQTNQEKNVNEMTVEDIENEFANF